MDSKSIPLQLFEPLPLLEQRLGADCFDKIPQSPGVYRFYNRSGELLYVGKAKNLRRRLFSYKRVKAGQVSRKVARLISLINEVIWVETETERDALLLENRMIRGDRPPFNHVNKEPETYYFAYLKPEKSGLEFRLAMRIHEETDEAYWHGCFKGHRVVRQSFGCLLRLLYMAEHGVRDPMHLPVRLTRNLTPMRYTLAWHHQSAGESSTTLQYGIIGYLNLFIAGKSDELLNWLAVRIDYSRGQSNRLTPFQTLYFEYHLECLKSFYDYKLVPHRKVRGKNRIVPQNQVDDLLVNLFTKPCKLKT